MPDANKTSRRRVLFLSYLYPSFLGTGSQIRAASIAHMFAVYEDIYLVVVHQEKNQLDLDINQEVIKICKKTLHVYVVEKSNQNILEQPVLNDSFENNVHHLDCMSGQILNIIMQFYKANHLNVLCLFRLESYCLMGGGLDFFPIKYLDLDELASKRNQLIAELKSQNDIENHSTAKKSNIILQLLEKKIIPQFNKVFVSSELEAIEVRHLSASDNIYIFPNVVPSRQIKTRQPDINPQVIFFVGTFSYYPNEDAVHYFCGEIFPLLRNTLKDNIIFRIVGLGCPPSFDVIEQQPGVELLKFQQDLALHYSSASLVVIPLRAGAGTRIKIIEAFAHGCPVVSTSIGAMGLNVTHEKNILLADEPESFAKACLRLLNDPDLASRLTHAGLKLHQTHYSMEALNQSYVEAISS